MLTDEDVFKHRELPEETDVLEGPGHALGADAMRLSPTNGRPLQTISPAVGT